MRAQGPDSLRPIADAISVALQAQHRLAGDIPFISNPAFIEALHRMPTFEEASPTLQRLAIEALAYIRTVLENSNPDRAKTAEIRLRPVRLLPLWLASARRALGRKSKFNVRAEKRARPAGILAAGTGLRRHTSA